MSDILDYPEGEKFVLRTQSSLTANRRVRWHNTYEARATAAGTLSELLGMASSLVGWQAGVTYGYVTLDQITVSTWAEDSHPYNPLGFTTVVYNQPGLQSVGFDTLVSLRNTLFLKRAVDTGLFGKLFLRGALIGSQLAYGDGEWVLDDLAALQALVDDQVEVNGLTNYLQGLGSELLALCMLGAAGETRWINKFDVGGTSDVKLNHKYFDRSPTP